MSLSGAHCGKHPALAAVEVCTRCGTFLCADCVEYVQEITAACADCAPLLRGVPASARAKMSPVLASLGFVGLVAGFFIRGRPGLTFWAAAVPLGFTGLALAVMELRLMRGSTVVQRGRRWARAGVVASGLFVVAFLALAVLFAWLFFTGRLNRR